MALGTGSVLATADTDKYKCDSNDAVFIKLVRAEDDCLQNDCAFHPLMSHQIFGESETIFGYKDLEVQLYYHAGSLLTYLSMKCKEKIPQALGINPDLVLPKVAEIIPSGFCSNLDEFMKLLPRENEFVPMGTMIHTYTYNDEQYEVYQADITVKGLRQYHERLQTFVLWMIDAASFIDTTDEKWNFFLLFKKEKVGNALQYSILGYMTVYHYFCYPDKYRPRISQALIFPPYQRNGHCTRLIKCVNDHYLADTKASDITVEDPSEDFVRCRDFVDCQNCMKLDGFKKEHLLQGFSERMEKAALDSFKINKQQSRRVYETLRLRVTDMSNKEMYQAYRIDVKNRLNIPYQKQARDMKKLQKALSKDEFNAAMVGQTDEERMQRLDEAYKQIEEEYRATIDRLDAN